MGQENAMTDSRSAAGGASFSKVVQKHAGRAREKILQNLGKADKTTDEVFDTYEGSFTRQQTNANRLHKEVSNYLRCARALHGASKALFDTLSEVYEPEWSGHDLIYAQAQNSDMLWTDFVHKLQDQSLAPLTAYQIQFPDLRKKIDKRGRKLVDYDSQRHQLEALQRSNRRDDYKMARCKDQLELARTTYDGLNKELYEELPALYDQRVAKTAEILQMLYAAETTFMRESSKISHELEAITDKLTQESSKGQYRTSRGTPVTPRPVSLQAPVQQQPPPQQATWFTEESTPEESPLHTAVSPAPMSSPNGGVDKVEESSVAKTAGNEPDPLDAEVAVPAAADRKKDAVVPSLASPPQQPQADGSPDESAKVDGTDSTIKSTVETGRKSSSGGGGDEQPSSTDTSVTNKSPREEIGRPYEEIQFEEASKVNGTAQIATKIPTDNKAKTDELYDIPVGATTSGLPAGVLYQVRTTYKYDREDVDELSFDVGELINVVEYEDPDEQEEGWLCGYKTTSNEKGLFPANFTRPI